MKEGEGKLATVGTRTGREAGCGRRACEQTRSPKLIKTQHVEPDGMRGKFRFLPGEISCARAQEKSAEAVVAMRAAETRKERRAEGTTSSALWSIAPRGKTSPDVGLMKTGGPSHSGTNSSSRRDAVAAGARGRGTPGGAHEPGTDSKAGGPDGAGDKAGELGGIVASH